MPLFGPWQRGLGKEALAKRPWQRGLGKEVSAKRHYKTHILIPHSFLDIYFIAKILVFYHHI
jgi:hypothetical protein